MMVFQVRNLFFLQISKSIFRGCMALIFWDARDALPRLLTSLIWTGGSQTKLSFATIASWDPSEVVSNTPLEHPPGNPQSQL